MKKIFLVILFILVVAILFIFFVLKPDNSSPVVTDIPTNELDKVGDYIRANISALSPIKESVGGRFFITSISFKDKAGIANYEDGHNAYSAAFSYSIDPNSNVMISNVKVIDISKLGLAAEFDKIGNITKPEGSQDWVLVYEEPGKPALTKKLALAGESLCVSGQEIFYCTTFVLTPGDRVEVKGGYVESDKVKILVLIKK